MDNLLAFAINNQIALKYHWLCHAHVTHAIERGTNPTLVKKTLGHSSLAITDCYLKAKLNDNISLKLMDV
ncbi:hypothetical protein EH233_29030 [Anabaena sp. YBS01]|nr:hypothetical protein EH233_29030 [Anabaena sp. YBS01]